MSKPLSRVRPAPSSSITDNAAVPDRGSLSKRIFRQSRRWRRGTRAEDQTRLQGMDASTDMGPLVSEEQMNRVCGYLESGFSEGAKAVVGGGRHGDQGYFVKPTVLVNTSEKMKVVQEEIFGPVVTAIPFKDADDFVPTSQRYRLWSGGWCLDQRHSEGPPSSPQRCVPARCGSTATTSSTRRCPSVATNSRDGAAKWVVMHSRCTPK